MSHTSSRFQSHFTTYMYFSFHWIRYVIRLLPGLRICVYLHIVKANQEIGILLVQLYYL